MPKIKCPHCEWRGEVEAEYIGIEVECPECNGDFLAKKLGGRKKRRQVRNSSSTAMKEGPIPGSARFLALYLIIGSLPCILFAMFCFTIPVEELTSQPLYIERDRGFITLMKILMFGSLLLYSLVHLAGGIGLIRGKSWGYKIALWLSVGILHLNPFAVPNLIICLRENVRQYYGNNAES